MKTKKDIKELISELFQLFVSLPTSKEKIEVEKIIHMISSGTSDIKYILLFIQGKIDLQKSTKNKDATVREQNIKFWNYVLSIFTKHLRS